MHFIDNQVLLAKHNLITFPVFQSFPLFINKVLWGILKAYT